MDLHKVSYIAQTLLKQYGLTGWGFAYSKRTTNLGHCDYQDKTIYLSAPWTFTGDEARVMNTLKHELAHALVGPGHNHDEVWRRKALELGCNGARCTSVTHEKPQMRYILSCLTHGVVHQMSKMTRTNYVCSTCKGVLTRAPNPQYASQYFAIEQDRPR